MNSVVILAWTLACLAHCALCIHVPVYPAAAINGAVYQGIHHGAAAAEYHGAHQDAGHHGVYSGAIANPVVLPSGFIADTPEVIAVRGAHLTALANARAAVAARGGHSGQWAADGSYPRGGQNVGGGRYVGPIANPVVLPNGFLADTPEVAAAKAAHLSTLAAHIPYAAGHAYHHGYAGHAYHHG